MSIHLVMLLQQNHIMKCLEFVFIVGPFLSQFFWLQLWEVKCLGRDFLPKLIVSIDNIYGFSENVFVKIDFNYKTNIYYHCRIDATNGNEDAL